MRVTNIGSINIDTVFRVPRLVRAGETLAAAGTRQFAGGKGANQSVALARAGAVVRHAGCVGEDGKWVVRLLADAGVDVSAVAVAPDALTGSAFIQVTDDGDNAIVLNVGANRAIPRETIDRELSRLARGDVVLIQNEINDVAYIIATAAARGLRVALNPAPISEDLKAAPLDAVDLLIANRTEAEGLTGISDPEVALRQLPGRQRVITRGEAGAICRCADGAVFRAEAEEVRAVDTTAAGDTFVGYYIASQLRGEPPPRCLEIACRAATICVTRAGAMASIPALHEVMSNPS